MNQIRRRQVFAWGMPSITFVLIVGHSLACVLAYMRTAPIDAAYRGTGESAWDGSFVCLPPTSCLLIGPRASHVRSDAHRNVPQSAAVTSSRLDTEALVGMSLPETIAAASVPDATNDMTTNREVCT